MIILFIRNQRSKRLRTRFGPEYSRVIGETGNKTQAEAKLEKLERRVERFELRPLTPVVLGEFCVAGWQKIQSRFVDDPKERPHRGITSSFMGNGCSGLSR